MTLYTLEPRDPLIARDGRPFNADPGAKASTLPFPMPSTIAGVARTRAGTDLSTGLFRFTKPSDKPDLDKLLEQGIRGPVLVKHAATLEFFAPAPNDAFVLKDGSVRRLAPEARIPDELTDLTSDLLPVFMTNHDNGKPHDKPPKYWSWKQFKKWLLDPQDLSNLPDGLIGPSVQTRSHVSVAHGTQTAVDGQLFQTSGLEFMHQPGLLGSAERLALAVETDLNIAPQIAPAGGERRLARWEQHEHVTLPEIPPDLLEKINEARACRVILLTPAHFTQGYRPTWLLGKHAGIEATLKAAACGRAQVVSGWDFIKNKPKPTRRLAPAGSVYFLKFGDTGDLTEWLNAIWMQNISDQPQDRLDGFGLAVVGAWPEGKEVS
jgi:CRISPR-associated protein Cmr3